MKQSALRSTLAEKGIRPAHLAREASVDKATVSRWLNRRVPAERVVDFERITGIPRQHVRPDLYPGEEFVSRGTSAEGAAQ